MAAIASAPPPLSPSRAGGPDPEDSNVSSPLSDVDDKDANEEDIEHMQLDGSEPDNSSIAGEDNPAGDNASDSGSELSEANSDVNSDGNDTEAETERLYDTPKSQRQRDVVVDQFNQGKVFERTPSKLRSTAAAAGDDDNNDDDAASIASSGPGTVDSPTKAAKAKPRTSTEEDTSRDSQERKRKRSPATDNSESEQPLRKRTGSVAAPDGEMSEDTLPEPKSKSQPTAEDAKRSPRKRDPPAEDDTHEVPERETRAAKKMTRNGTKRRGAELNNLDHADVEAVAQARDEARGAATEDDVEQHDDEAEADVEDVDDEADIAAKNIEELERKQAAYKDWTNIEDMFCIFRDRLYKDRLQKLEEEEQSLLADVPTHPEYLNMKQCLDERLERKLQEINTEHEFRIKAHQKRAVAQRGQIWGQFFQAVRETRERALEALNQEWYEVQSARRGAHSLPDYGLLFPRDPAQQVRNAVAYNTEVSTLAGLAKYQGFPAGPEMRGVSAAELEDDLMAMDPFRQTRPRTGLHPRDDFQPPTFNHIGPAGEQFLKETPWANPQHSAHKMHPANVGQMDARHDNRGQLSHGLGAAAAAAAAAESKPMTESTAPIQRPPLAAHLSESPEMPRSLLNPAAHQMSRVKNIPSISRGSKTAAA